MSETAAALVRRVFESLFRGELDVLDSHPGMKALSEAFPMLRTAFPDVAIELQQQLVEGDRVVSHWIITGTHLGPFLGIPATGKPVRYQNIGIAQVLDGVIVQYNAESGWLAVLKQIGALPLSPPAVT